MSIDSIIVIAVVVVVLGEVVVVDFPTTTEIFVALKS